MRNYGAENIAEWIGKYHSYFQFVLVAHTNLRPKDLPQVVIDTEQRKRSEYLGKSLYQVSKTLYEDKPYLPMNKREEFGLIQFSTVEFNDPYVRECDTLHFNVMIGNVPNDYSKEKFLKNFLDQWKKVHHQSSDVWIKSVDELNTAEDRTYQPISAFNRYILKDAYKNKSNAWRVDGTWDVLNTWLPSKLLETNEA